MEIPLVWLVYLMQGPVSPSLSPGAQPSNGLASVYGISQMASSSTAFPGPYSPLQASTGPSSSAQNEKQFPERPGQPECQHYMKTGNCKFGSSCRYHHPPGWNASNVNIAFSPLGLPLRPVSAYLSFIFHFVRLPTYYNLQFYLHSLPSCWMTEFSSWLLDNLPYMILCFVSFLT